MCPFLYFHDLCASVSTCISTSCYLLSEFVSGCFRVDVMAYIGAQWEMLDASGTGQITFEDVMEAAGGRYG